MSWEQKPLEEVADFCLGKMLDQNKNKGEFLPYLANVNVRWGEFDLDELRKMRFEPGELQRYGLKSGDIVMCEGGEPGRCALWKDQVPDMMIQKALHRIRPHEVLDSRFLYYSFLKKGRNNELAGLFTGATIKHLPREKLAKVIIDFPELSVQKRIADILSGYDGLIENNRRRIALLEEAARLLYREWFVYFRFPSHEHVKIINGAPEGWERRHLGEMFTLKRGYDLPENRRLDGDIPVVSSSGITGHHNQKRCIAPGVVTGRYGTLGEVFFLQEDFWPLNTALYISDFKGTPPQFAAYMLRNTLAGMQSDKAAVPGLNRNVLHEIEVLAPPHTLVWQFAEFATDTYRQIFTLDNLCTQLAAARDLLLPRLMSGELAV